MDSEGPELPGVAVVDAVSGTAVAAVSGLAAEVVAGAGADAEMEPCSETSGPGRQAVKLHSRKRAIVREPGFIVQRGRTRSKSTIFYLTANP